MICKHKYAVKYTDVSGSNLSISEILIQGFPICTSVFFHCMIPNAQCTHILTCTDTHAAKNLFHKEIWFLDWHCPMVCHTITEWQVLSPREWRQSSNPRGRRALCKSLLGQASKTRTPSWSMPWYRPVGKSWNASQLRSEIFCSFRRLGWPCIYILGASVWTGCV